MPNMVQKWQAHVQVIMRLICEQNDLPANDLPDVPADLYDGTGLVDRGRMVQIAYDLLAENGRLGGKGGDQG